MIIVNADLLLAKTIPALVTSVLKPIVESVAKQIKGYTTESWEQYRTSLAGYLSETQEKHKYFSSEVFANEGKLLDDYYLPLTLQKMSIRGSTSTVRVKGFPQDLYDAYKDVLIIDTAGMGKSTLLKYMFLKQLEVASSVPIFVELRRISKALPLMEYVLTSLSIGATSIQRKFLTRCLDAGMFTFYLDGFDEVSDDDKRDVATDITSLKNSFNKNHFIISSRQEDSLASLAEFHRFRIRPLREAEAYDLIRVLSPSPVKSESLIEKLQAKTKHNLDEFLKNPLLVSLLVKSYLHSPILPVRLSEFYRQVFDALYQNHDAKKELWGYAREKKSELDLDRFHKAMRALGYLSYRSSKLEFKRDEFLRQIEDVKSLTLESNYTAASFEDDLLRAVPLFVREGNSIRWAHRSLQEYFAASYICTDSKGNQERVLYKIYEALTRNANILKLCADIDEKTFKQTIVKRFLSETIKQVSSTYCEANFRDIDESHLELRRVIPGVTKIGFFAMPHEVLSEDAFSHFTPEADELSSSDASTGFWELGADFQASGPDDDFPILYVVFDGPEVNFLPELFESHYGVTILKNLELEPMVGQPLVGVAAEKLYFFNDNPDNPLNSAENFDLLTVLLINLKKKVWDIEAMTGFLREIETAEANAAALDLDFD